MKLSKKYCEFLMAVIVIWSSFTLANSSVTGEFLAQRPVCGALMFPLICGWINGRINIRAAGDLRSHRVHYDIIVMKPRDVTPKDNSSSSAHRCDICLCTDIDSGNLSSFIGAAWLSILQIHEILFRFNSSAPEQNGNHFINDSFRCIFVNENVCILIKKITWVCS